MSNGKVLGLMRANRVDKYVEIVIYPVKIIKSILIQK